MWNTLQKCVAKSTKVYPAVFPFLTSIKQIISKQDTLPIIYINIVNREAQKCQVVNWFSAMFLRKQNLSFLLQVQERLVKMVQVKIVKV